MLAVALAFGPVEPVLAFCTKFVQLVSKGWAPNRTIEFRFADDPLLDPFTRTCISAGLQLWSGTNSVTIVPGSSQSTDYVKRTGILGDLISWEDGVYGTSKSVFSGGA
jgi:hypothetical protein